MTVECPSTASPLKRHLPPFDPPHSLPIHPNPFMTSRTMSDTPESSYGPTAALLWTLPPFRDSLFKHLSPAQSTQALTWSRPSYAQALKAKYGVIRMMRYRRYQPRFSDPVSWCKSRVIPSVAADLTAPLNPLSRLSMRARLPGLCTGPERPGAPLLLSHPLSKRHRDIR